MAPASPPASENEQGDGSGDHSVHVEESQTGSEESQGLLESFAKGQLERLKDEVTTLMGVAVSVLTLAFAAALQPPGGKNPDPRNCKLGSANLLQAESNAFWVFFVANGCAMLFSSFSIVIMVSFRAKSNMEALLIRGGAAVFNFIAIQCSLAAFCAWVWVLVGEDKYKVIPSIVGSGLADLGFCIVFVYGQRANVLRVQNKWKKSKARLRSKMHTNTYRRSKKQPLPV